MSRHHQRSLANKRSVENTHKASERKRLRNQAARSRARTMVTTVRRSVQEGDFDAATQNVPAAMSALDKAAAKGIIHRNNAARRKSRLMKALANARKQA